MPSRNARNGPDRLSRLVVDTNHGVVAGVIHGPVTVTSQHPRPSGSPGSAGNPPAAGVPPPIARPEPELAALLCVLFDREEFARFLDCVCPDGELTASLPASSLAAIVHAAVAALCRRGMLGEGFFDALLQARPARRRDIEAVAAVHGSFPRQAT